MELFIEKLKKLRQGIYLRSDRKEAVRQNLVRFMAEQEVRRRDFSAGRVRTFGGGLFRPMPAFAAFVLLLVVMGSSGYAAQAALPGEWLYPVKILNEEVRSAFTLDAEAQIEWETVRAERRLDEAAKLAAEGKLKPELQDKLEERFARHADNVRERIAALAAKENFAAAAGLAARFEASLDAHNRILARLGEPDRGPDRGDVVALNREVKQQLDTVQEARTVSETEAEAQVEDSANARNPAAKTAAEGKIASAAKAFEEASAEKKSEPPPAPMGAALAPLSEDGAGDPEAAGLSLRAAGGTEAETEMEAGRRILAEARAQFEAGNYAEAFRLANQAVRAAQKAKVLLKAEKELRIRIEAGPRGEPVRDADEVDDFEDCMEAGYPVMESHPRQCRTPDGKNFTEKIEGEVRIETDVRLR